MSGSTRTRARWAAIAEARTFSAMLPAPEDRRVLRVHHRCQAVDAVQPDAPLRRAAHPDAAVHQLQIVEVGLQLIGGDVERLLAGVLARLDDRRADDQRDLAAAGHRRVRRARAVGVRDGHPLDRQAERLGRDLEQRRVRAGDVHRADHRRDRAVRLQPAERAGRLERHHQRADRHPDALVRACSADPSRPGARAASPGTRAARSWPTAGRAASGRPRRCSS